MTQLQLAKIAGVSERELRRIETGDVTLKGTVVLRYYHFPH
jgi:DNA-binding XRE family transcriptional regulator